MKYVLVTGGVISGLGKGIISSSIGVVLQAHGLRVSVIKIDPYLNIDAGTFSPFEHGEVYVLDDGGEVDLDLGNYERFLNVKLNRDNNITTGKIYMDVITREREGHFLGRTVQVIPHITDAIQEWVERVACQPVDGSGIAPDICIIELGGTIGDIESMPFVEAFRQFQFRVRRDNFLSVHVSLLPEPYSTGEQKTKPTQHSVRELRGQGLYPEIIICRSRSVLLPTTKRKISNFCHVDIDQVISVHDVSNLYRVPLLMAEQRVFEFMFRRLNLLASNYNSSSLEYWRKLAQLQDSDRPPVRIALVGKYVELRDAYASVFKALEHAALACNRRLEASIVNSEGLEEVTKLKDPELYNNTLQMLENCDGILVPGGFGERGIEGKVAACRWARQKKVPFLGICLGMQCAVIEFARNVLGLKDANSTEFSQDTSAPVVIEMPEHNTGKMGGTMRLGLRTTVFRKDLHSVVRQLYGNVPFIRERHRHRYEVNPSYVSLFEKQGMLFTGTDDQRMEIFELQRESPYYIGVQFHPEYLSSPLNPSPLFVGLILASINQLHTTLSSSTVQLPLKGLWNNCHSTNGSTEQCALQT
ncbi:CTP synthase [Trichinella nativa]|uniref:CTP synthase n=1 Tax=Trichinella nativa TaxID=6335 RepID=A0A0V1LKX4_9BILA|nr:CTP synthase [Trichinella nativa]OUC45358.1 CTP synthase [Trichinella nativa]